MAQLTCKNLTLGYDNRAIQEDLNFSIDAGDYLCIVGENGSGKSTLMKTLLHLQPPISGSIELGDGLKKNEIGYLPQQTLVQRDFPASVREIVLSGCQSRCGLRPFYNKEEKMVAQKAMEKMMIQDLADQCYSELSGGAFDITIEPVSSLWDFTSGEKIVPDAETIAEKQACVGYEDVELKGNKLRFKKEGMGIELGAVAKGYIADKVKEYLVSEGVKSAVIDLGGNVLCVGEKPDGKPFKIGIQKPFADRSETVSAVEIAGTSVVSSGIYERYFEKDGKLYHHILDPATGYPYENGLVSVTVLSEESADGDGLSTACFALGLEKGLELIEQTPDTEAMFITEDGEMHFSKGFVYCG